MQLIELIGFIVKIIQLPIMVFFIIICFNPIFANRIGISEDSENSVDKVKRQSLKMIGAGIVSNFIYMVLQIWSNPIFGADALNTSSVKSIINSFDIITAFFFFLSGMHFYLMCKKKKILQKNIYYISLSILSIVFLTLIWFDIENYLSLFNLIAYMLAAIILFGPIKIDNFEKRRRRSSKFIFYSLIVWSLLQILAIKEDFILDQDVTNLVGFLISLICKSLILWGLYLLSINSVKTVALDLERKNYLLQSSVDKITKLQTKINEISNANNIKVLAEKLVVHLTDKDVFNFDYVIFSEINYLKQKIIYVDSKTRHKKIVSPESWILPEGIDFSHHDILAEVYRERKIIQVFQNYVEDVKIDLKKEESILNYDIYTNYNHKELHRFFIPIFDIIEDTSKNHTKSNNKAVAIIEAGYHLSNFAQQFEWNDVVNVEELSLYLDNCSQTYERLFENEISIDINSLLHHCDIMSSDDDIKYLEFFNNELCKLVNADFSFITLCTKGNSLNKSKFINSFNNFTKNERKLIFEKLIRRKENIIFSFEDVQILEKELSEELTEYYEKSSSKFYKILEEDHLLGFIFIFKKDKKFFNEIVEATIKETISYISKVYIEKKFHHSISRLITPDNVLTDLEANFKPMISILEEYYGTPYISIWMYDDNSFQKNLVQKYATEKFKLSCQTYGEFKKVIVPTFRDDCQIIDLDTEFKTDENKIFWDYAQRNEMMSLLHKPLNNHNQYYGFINIYFKNKLKKSFIYNSTFLNLVAQKALVTIQVNSIVNSFLEISDSFTRNNLKDTLKIITDKAMELLNADPVILFNSDGTSVFFKNVTYSNLEEFKDKKIIDVFEQKGETPVGLAEFIIKNKTTYFNNHLEYKEFTNKYKKEYNRNIFREDFWTREEIKSMAAVKLTSKRFGDRVFGVMFINFRNEIVFTNEIRKIIETFADFAAGSIANGFVSERNRKALIKNFKKMEPVLHQFNQDQILHDASKTYKGINGLYFKLIRKIDDVNYGKKITIKEIREALEKLREPVIKLHEKFKLIDSVYKIDDELDINRYNIIYIIEAQLESLKTEFDKKLIKPHTNFSKKIIYIDCDRVLIGDVIYNLLHNAYEAVGKRGHIEVKVQVLDDENIIISIIDNGKGIDEEVRELIMYPYVTYKPGGSGIGLAMSKAVVKQHGGNLRFTSRNKRTTFSIILPIKNNNLQENDSTNS